MLIYIVALLLIIIMYCKINKRWALFFSFFIFTLIAALRSFKVGVDTEQFYNTYQYIGNLSWNFEGIRYELLYCVFVKILYNFSKNPQLLLIVSSIFINFSFYLFIKKNSKYYFLSTLLYVFMNIFFTNMNALREALAISITLLSFEFLKKKKIFSYLLFSIIAFLFHKTGVLSLLILIIFYLSKFKKTSLVLIASGFICFIMYSSLFSVLSKVIYSDYLGYLNSDFSRGGNVGAILEFILYLLVFFVSSYYVNGTITKNIPYSHTDNNQLNMFYFNISLTIIIFLGLTIRMNIFNRISMYVLPFFLIVLPNTFVLIFKKNQINTNHVSLIKMNTSFSKAFVINSVNIQNYILLVFIFYWLIVSIFRSDWSGCSNYSFFWNAI